MAQQDNAAFVRDMHEAFKRGDIQYLVNNAQDDVEWVIEGPKAIPHAGTHYGKAGMLKFFQSLAATQDDVRITVEEIISERDRAVVLGRYTATVRATGKHIDLPIVHVYTIRGGKLARFAGYGDTAAIADAYTAATRGSASRT